MSKFSSLDLEPNQQFVGKHTIATASKKTSKRRNDFKRRPAMTAADAQTFSHTSEENALILKNIGMLNGCGCQPYVDWFTLKRWNAQGFKIVKGSKSITIQTFVPLTKLNGSGKEETITIPHNTHVFCRHQVEAFK